ncbi:hypothetical protein M8J75_013650 [Diaphorina citri]|nr:hypothetical protein M8J75_013650 [Diaphorina citri]
MSFSLRNSSSNERVDCNSCTKESHRYRRQIFLEKATRSLEGGITKVSRRTVSLDEEEDEEETKEEKEEEEDKEEYRR